MKILITGISGFVGRHYVELLSSSGGDYEVAGIYFQHVPAFAENQYPNVSCKFYQVDLLGHEALRQLLIDFRPEQILHLAGKSSVANSWLDPAASITGNTAIFLNIIEQVRLLELPCRILSVGSTEEYGYANAGEPLKETACPLPASPYGAARVMQQKLVEVYSKNYGLDIVHTRSFNHIGPYQDDHFVISSFARQIAMQLKDGKEKIELTVGDVEVIRDFTDVRDVVKAYQLLFEKGRQGETYNVCSNNGLVLKDVIAKYSELTSTPIEYKMDSRNFRPSENKHIIGSYDKLHAETGWEPKIPIEQSLLDLLDYWKGKVAAG